MKPLISVIMSVYNDSQNLKSSVDSVLNQDFKDFELLLMDDGSIILYEYRGRLRLDETGGDLWGNGDPIKAGEGMAYWIGVPLLKTKSEKYAWVNEAVFLMRGNILVPPGKSDDPMVQYDLYQVEYNF